MSLFDRKPGKLRKLVIDRVDLVDAGANPDAHIMLYKAEDGEPVDKRDYSAEQRRQMAADGHAMPDGSYPIADKADLQNAVHAVGRGNAPHADIKAHIMRRAKALGAMDMIPPDWMMKSVDAPEAPTQVNKEVAPVADTPDPTPEADLTALQDAIDTAVAKALADHDAALAELAKADEPEPTEINKAELPEAVVKRLEELEKAAERVDRLEKAARDARFADEATKVSLTTVDAATLDAIEKAAPEAYETLTKALATCQERIAKSDLFREIGSNGDGAGDSPADRLDAIAKKFAADDGTDYATAYRKACDQNRELAAEAVRAA